MKLRRLFLVTSVLALSALQTMAADGSGKRTVPDTLAQRVQACTVCHGAEGRASSAGYLPRIAGKPQGYLANQLRAFRDGQRNQPAMRHLLQHLSDAYLDEIAGYFARLDLPYPPAQALTPSADSLRRGQGLVRYGDTARKIPACSRCHGEALMGVTPATPGLLGLPRDYLVGQLGAWQAGRRHARAPDCMGQVANRLSVDDISAVAGWLSTQAVPANAKPAASVQQPLPLTCGALEPPVPVPAPSPDLSKDRGAYLARLGNCAGCHTAPGGAAYAGGVGIATPFGTVYAGNLTPDPETGLGQWNADDFWNALHHGRSRDGRWLNPAFPYTSFTHIQRGDSDALFAYLRSLPAVRQSQRASSIAFPYNTQLALGMWRTLYFKSGSFEPDPRQSASWNRGAYLVQGLGHCAECHAPRNTWGATVNPQALSGGMIPMQRWWAPPLGLAQGSSSTAVATSDTLALLKTGQTHRHSLGGPMADVVVQSTQYLTTDDAQAVAIYLHGLAAPAKPTPSQVAQPASSSQLQAGQALYTRHCADCHGAQGQGFPGAYPALAGNPAVTQAQTVNLVHRVLDGGFAPATAAQPRPYSMPPYRHLLSDAQVAAILSFVRQAWGNNANAVSTMDVVQGQ